MPSYAEPSAFRACYAQFQQADADRDVLFNQLLDGYQALHVEHTRVREQLEKETEARIMWQDNARAYKKELTKTKLATESHPFVVMIIDGDGAKFKDDFFRNGENGGGFAAQELKNQIKACLQAKYPDTSIENWNIIVHFYANMDGLAKTLASRRILATFYDLQRFASGFGRANSLFSFVDVGHGKDKADHKCREMLKAMLHVSSCRHVFFGPCRDNGYLTHLDEYKHDPVLRDKLTLFTAEPAQPGFVDLGFDIVSFPNVFRSEPLDNIRYAQPIGVDIGVQPFPSASGVGVSQSDSLDNISDLTATSSTAVTGVSSPSSAGNNSVSGPHTWASVSKISNGPVIDIYSSKKATAATRKPKYALFNSINQRIDERLPSFEASALKSIDNKARLQGRNFCNYHHLTGHCDKGDTCEYQHDVQPRLAASEKLALFYKSRQIFCQEGQWCENPQCMYGHHCRNIHNGQLCIWGAKCFFKDTHDTDVKPTLKVYEDGSREDLTLHCLPSGR